MASTTSAECVPDLLRVRAAADPDGVALRVDGTDGLTFGDWDGRSDAVARGLTSRGVRPGDRVALLFDNRHWLDYAVCYLAAHKAGATAVPLSPRFAPAELARVVAHCEPAALVCDPALRPDVGVAPMLAAELADGRHHEPFQAPLRADDLAEILYTSGTTGTPKGVACSHESILFFDLPVDPEAEAGGRSILHAFPIGTNAAQELLRVPLRRPGLTAVVLSAFDPERLCQVVSQHAVRRLQLVPAMAQVLLASEATDRHDLSSVERITLSSAPTPPALVARLKLTFPEASIWIAYALTESGGARTLARCDERWHGSVGRPVGESEVRIVDDNGCPLPAGETGEVWLRRQGSPRRAYYGDDEATAAAWVDGWLRTGDLGYLDGEGDLYLVDRKKDLIITGGLNVSSLEVENVLSEHPAVGQVAVFGVPHDVMGQDVAAAVVLARPVAARELQALVRGRLGEAKVPHRLFFVDELPVNPAGKVVKRALRERFSEPVPRSASGPVTTGAGTDTERTIAAIWAEVLALPEVSLDVDFFDLGGHSLAAARVAARLQDAFGVELPVTSVFEWPTVAELAAAIDSRRTTADDR